MAYGAFDETVCTAPLGPNLQMLPENLSMTDHFKRQGHTDQKQENRRQYMTEKYDDQLQEVKSIKREEGEENRKQVLSVSINY